MNIMWKCRTGRGVRRAKVNREIKGPPFRGLNNSRPVVVAV
jgi:hypothetical protein